MTRQRLQQRLQQLETHARMQKQTEADDHEVRLQRMRNRLRLFLYVCGVEQQGNESLLETWARALGVALRDLRGMLAAGIDPIRKYFTETGVYDEIDRRKAAGTWPSGSDEGCANVSA